MALEPDTLLRIVHGLRCGVLALYCFILIETLTPAARVWRRQTRPGDLFAIVMLTLSVSLVTFQIQWIGPGIETRIHPFTAAALFGLIVTGLIYECIKSRAIPDEHKRAVIFAPFGIAAVSLFAGALS